MLFQWAQKNLKTECMFDRADEIDSETYNAIADINPCEIFHTNVNHFLETLVPIYRRGMREMGIEGWRVGR